MIRLILRLAPCVPRHRPRDRRWARRRQLAPAFAASKTRVVAIPFSSDLYASPEPQRFSIVLQQGGADGIKYVSGPPVQVRFKGPDGNWTSPIPMVLDRAGLPKGRGVYHSLATFGQAGIWDGEASFSGTTSKFSMTLPATAVAPVAGPAGAPGGVAHQGRDPRREADLHPRPAVPAPHRLVGGRGGCREAGGGAVRHARALYVAVLRARPRRDALDHEALRGQDHVRPRRHLQGPQGDRGVAHGHGVGAAERAVALHDRRRRHDRVAARHRVRQRKR